MATTDAHADAVLQGIIARVHALARNDTAPAGVTSTRSAPARRRRATGATPTPAEVLHDVAAQSAVIAARAAARNRARAIREVARDLARCAETIDRVHLTGAERLRAEAARYASVAETVESTLRTR